MLAHQGGWDEILLVLGPILLIAGLLVLAGKRARRHAAGQAGVRADAEASPSSTQR